ncbi:hypothetical protein QZH41_012572 [Actinostola sp. cb2023]|nr:hypothetical protein QZH41_012572 [Actinostola sp. cb2023]
MVKVYCGLGDVIHELGHTLGFFHEQARPDRDNYVTINLKNLAPGNKCKHMFHHHHHLHRAASNFDKVDRRWVDYRGVDYDYGSLMHYGKYAFASYGKVTIQPKDRNARIGQKNGLSGPDIAQLNKMYNC